MPGTNPGTTGLVSWWSLDEASGQRNDSHGTNHLTDNNTVLSAAGKVGNAADFEADNSEYLSIADNPDISIGEESFTWAAWVYLESKSQDLTFINKDGDISRGPILLYAQASDRFNLSLPGINDNLANALGSPSIQTWYFIVGWIDASLLTINIQINNGAVNSTLVSSLLPDNTNPFYVGARQGPASFMDGLIDEPLFAKKVYTADERTWLYNDGAGRAYSELTAGLAVPVMLASDQFAGGISL